MIRFCDKEVMCISYDELNRSDLFKYFLNDHLDDPVCVFDANNGYMGCITYPMLVKFQKMDDAILRDRIVLDKDIWNKARLLFARCKENFRGYGVYMMLPVVDERNQLVCFAYEDFDANRELRMLRELRETENALQFMDLYPEYQCVKIHGFNELAYFFAVYLVEQKIPIQVDGSMWETFFSSSNEVFLEYNMMHIYAEGINQKPVNWMENLMRSASAEFEYIDHIYEKNIIEGVIKNADMGTEDFIHFLKGSKEVIMLGTNIYSLDAYDYFKKMGVEICCFASDDYFPDRRWLFGKPILRRIEAMEAYEHAVFCAPYEKGSAWGMGEADAFDYLGYRRNREFFVLQDYVELEISCLKNALKGQKIVLAGDEYFCDKLADYLEENAGYRKDLLEHIAFPGDKEFKPTKQNLFKITKCRKENYNKHKICLIVVPEIFWPSVTEKTEARKQKMISLIKEYGIDDYTDYFSDTLSFIHMEADRKDKYRFELLKPKRVILGSINSLSGNMFFRELLDYHPSILMIDYNFLNSNLFWFCICLSNKTGADICSLFCQLYSSDWEDERLADVDLFMEKLNQLLESGKIYTSQELFIAFHIAYMYMLGQDIKDINDKIIYWEAHHMKRNTLEECAVWLGTKEVQCDIVNVVRNICVRNGSLLKSLIINGRNYSDICDRAITPGNDEKIYSNCERTVVRFEDLKIHPKEELYKLCIKWDIPWSDSMLHTTFHGKEGQKYWNGEKDVKGFDLSPVYNTYEEYFSEFDRFKIALICAFWQKKYGYPYVDYSQFSKRELQEIFLKEFKFMDRVCFDSERTRLQFKINFQNRVRIRLQKLKMLMSFCDT